MQTWLVEGSKTLFQQLASYGGVAFLGAVGTVLAFTVMLFILFFIIRDGRAIARLGSTVVPLPPDRREALAQRLASVTRAVVRGTVLTSIVQGLLLGIGFALIRHAGAGRVRRAGSGPVRRPVRRHGAGLGACARSCC